MVGAVKKMLMSPIESYVSYSLAGGSYLHNLLPCLAILCITFTYKYKFHGKILRDRADSEIVKVKM